MTTIDLSKPYTRVGGREPLAYMQGGYGFDSDMKCLGQFTASGEPITASDEVEDELEARRKPGRPKKL